ncbi:hypothetical protein [Companilactobacillus mishanensis]|nr:hypothetical protein [Companilactobacillus mishanensis]
MKVTKSSIFTTFTFLCVFIYFAIFRLFLIPVGDDYFWYGDKGMYLLHHAF